MYTPSNSIYVRIENMQQVFKLIILKGPYKNRNFIFSYAVSDLSLIDYIRELEYPLNTSFFLYYNSSDFGRVIALFQRSF